MILPSRFKEALTAGTRFKPLRPGHKTEAAASLLQAMGNPARLLMLHAMSEQDMTVSQLARIVGRSQSSTSQHLAILLEAGLVTRRREGQMVYYSVASPHVRKLLDYLRFMV